MSDLADAVRDRPVAVAEAKVELSEEELLLRRLARANGDVDRALLVGASPVANPTSVARKQEASLARNAPRIIGRNPQKRLPDRVWIVRVQRRVVQPRSEDSNSSILQDSTDDGFKVGHRHRTSEPANRISVAPHFERKQRTSQRP